MSNDPRVDVTLARSMGLSTDEWERILQILGRAPTYAELGVFSVMWSEHCSYKSSRVHLGRLPTTGKRVVQGPGENAGAVDIGDGYSAVFKMESHNHPSFIEPYQGAATGVGGILRDVFTMGARPIASLNSLRFGAPNHPLTKRLLTGVVAGIGGYGNCVGVPTVGGEVQFDASYNGNILVNAFTVGVAKTDRLFFGRAEGVGNPILYVGAKTGRDGIHGATMASQEFDDKSAEKLPTVQVGDPFKEKLLLEACLEIFATDCLEGVQDMGAAGLTSSSVEMAARAENGIELDLDRIPRRTQRLTPYEMLLSESQERMLMVAKRGRENEVIAICEKWDLDVAIIGTVTNTKRFVCVATEGFDPTTDPNGQRTPKIVVDIPIGALTDDAPRYNRPQKARSRPEQKSDTVNITATIGDLTEVFFSILGSPNIGSRHRVWQQYDHVVRNGTLVRPGDADAAVVRVFTDTPGHEKYLALSVDCNGRHVQLDPYHGAAMAVAECCRNIVCTGGQPLGLTDCLNFGNPENPEIMWQFSKAIDGIAESCKVLDVPVVSGNVSFYNETDGKAIFPTPTVAVVGQLAAPEDIVTLAFKNAGDMIALVGPVSTGALEGSEWLLQKTGSLGDTGLRIDLDAERDLQHALLELAKARLLCSAHDVSDGGLAVCLAESCIKGRRGCDVNLPVPPGSSIEGALFGEEPSRVIISFSAESQATIEQICLKHDVPFVTLGRVVEHAFRIGDQVNARLTDMSKRYLGALDSVFGLT